jgi:hypothetical protein
MNQRARKVNSEELLKHTANISVRFRVSVLQSLVPPIVTTSSLNLYTLMMEKICSSEASVLTIMTRRHIQEEGNHHNQRSENFRCYVRFEVSTAVTIENGVFCDVTPCGFCKKLRFGGT